MTFDRNTISRWLDPVRKNIASPTIMATGLGLAGAGLGVGLWRNIVETGGSLGRYPIRKITGMSNAEYDQAMEELAADERYRWLIPGALGLMLGGGYLALRNNPNQDQGGRHQWIPKAASVNYNGDDLWTYGGFVPGIDFSKVVNAKDAKSMFTNDPNIVSNPYVLNTGLAIINSASNRAGYTNPTLGDIYDAARDKEKRKLSWAGVTNVAANTMLANATAHLFTGALDAVVGLDPDTQRNIIDTTTWATAITSILT